MGFAEGPVALDERREQRAQFERPHVEVHFPGAGLFDVEDVVHQVHQAVAVLDRDVDHADGLGREGAGDAVGDEAEGAAAFMLAESVSRFLARPIFR